MTLSQVSKEARFFLPENPGITVRKTGPIWVEVLSTNRSSVARGQKFFVHPNQEVCPLPEEKTPRKKKKK